MKPFPAPLYRLVFHEGVQREEEDKEKKNQKKKKKPCLCKPPILSRFLILFLEASLVKLLRCHFLFMSSPLWFKKRQFWDEFCNVNSPAVTPQSPFMINEAYSEVKIHGSSYSNEN